MNKIDPRIRDTEQFKQIQQIYPSDIAVIVAIYLLDRHAVLKKSWFYNQKNGDMSVINGKIVISGDGNETYNMNGAMISEILHGSMCSYCVGDGSYVYVADYIENKLSIYNGLTGVRVSQHNVKTPWGIAIMNDNVYIVGIFPRCVYKYNTTRNKFTLKWDLPYGSYHIKTYSGFLYVENSGNVLKYNEYGDICDVIKLSPKKRFSGNFMIYEDKIYTCEDEGVWVYDMDGKYVGIISGGKSKDVAVWNDNIIVSTANRVMVYSMEY